MDEGPKADRDGAWVTRHVVGLAIQGHLFDDAGKAAAAITTLESMFDERMRMAGSRAQLDLVDFMLLKAYLAPGRKEDARRLMSKRRPGPTGIPVAGIEALVAT